MLRWESCCFQDYAVARKREIGTSPLYYKGKCLAAECLRRCVNDTPLPAKDGAEAYSREALLHSFRIPMSKTPGCGLRSIRISHPLSGCNSES